MAHVYVDSNAAGAGTGADWANAYTTIGAAFAAKAAGDNFWVAHNHAETSAAAKTLSSPGTVAAPCTCICVNSAGSVPPVSADLRTTATVTTTGNSNLSVQGSAATTGTTYYYGITFSCGTTAVSPLLTVGGTRGQFTFDTCNLNVAATGTGASIGAGFASSSTSVRASGIVLKNTSLSFGNVAQSVNLVGGHFIWQGGATSGSVPTNLFSSGSSGGAGDTLIERVDLSALGSGKTLVASGAATRNFIFKDCKLGAGVTVAATPTAPSNAQTYLVNCDSGATNYRNEKYQYMGTLTTSSTIIRTGGASDGTTGYSWKLVTTANSTWLIPFEALPIAEWNSTTAANVTVTIEGVLDAAALPNNDEFWIDVEYLGASTSPLGSFKSGTKADFLATGAALTASTEAWDSQATARANTTAYVVGDIFKVATNSGRIFFCTTAGTTAGSEPAGYATAVDGGSVTDNTAVFRAGMRFKQTVTLSSPQPAQIGVIYAYPKAAKVSSTFFIDPKITLA